jgi:hypothetical protein
VVLAPASSAGALEPEIVRAALKRAEPRVRRDLSEIVRLKRTPVVRLQYLPLPVWADADGMSEERP